MPGKRKDAREPPPPPPPLERPAAKQSRGEEEGEEEGPVVGGEKREEEEEEEEENHRDRPLAIDGWLLHRDPPACPAPRPPAPLRGERTEHKVTAPVPGSSAEVGAGRRGLTGCGGKAGLKPGV